MKKIFGLVFLCFSIAVHSQSLVDSLSNPAFNLEDTIGKSLADMVTQSPEVKMVDKQIEASRFEWKTNKASWLNNINASFNLNERNLTGSSDPNSNLFYPRYNFNLNIPLGNFITKAAQAKKARAQYEETQFKKEVAVRELRQSILIAYQNYSMAKYLLKLQDIVIQDESRSYDQVESRFKTNAVSIETFTAAAKRKNDALSLRVSMMRNLNVAKYELETIIGMRLETALATIARQRPAPVRR
jgi:outer membrane protein TolC